MTGDCRSIVAAMQSPHSPRLYPLVLAPVGKGRALRWWPALVIEQARTRTRSDGIVSLWFFGDHKVRCLPSSVLIVTATCEAFAPAGVVLSSLRYR